MRIAKKVTMEEAIEKLVFSPENKRLVEELNAKVKFDFENWGDHGLKQVGDLIYLDCYAGGDWEYPVSFIVYWDGRLRAYIPKEGNAYNWKTKEAFGNGDDMAYINGEYVEVPNPDYVFMIKWLLKNKIQFEYVDEGSFELMDNEEKRVEDIKKRIRVI